MPQLILASFIIGLIIMLIGLAWNMFVSTLHFGLIWFPPLALCASATFHPAIQTWFSAELYADQGLGDWTSSEASIATAWKSSKVRRTVYYATFLSVAGWSLVVPWRFLWPGTLDLPLFMENEWSFTHDMIEDMFYSKSLGAILYIGLATTGASVGIDWLLRWSVTKRVFAIGALVKGTDASTSTLSALDGQITAEYGKYGTAKSGEYAPAYRLWISSNVQAIIQNRNAAESEYSRMKAKADAELLGLKKCSSQYDNVRSACQRALANLAKKPSLALHGALEEVTRALDADALVGLIEANRWDDIDAYLSEVASDLANLDKIADSVPDDSNDSAHFTTVAMTVDVALKELGLSPSYTKEDVNDRRKKFAKIFHPDYATHDSQKEQNEKRMQQINNACDVLLKARS